MGQRFKKPLSELQWKRRRGQEVALKKKTLTLIGQTQPVVINAAGQVLFEVYEVLCQAAKELGWTEVEVYLNAETVVPCG